MSLGLAVSRWISKNGDVRRMLLRNDKRQTDIAKFKQSPSRILIDNFAFKVCGVPVHGGGNVTDTHRNVVERI